MRVHVYAAKVKWNVLQYLFGGTANIHKTQNKHSDMYKINNQVKYLNIPLSLTNLKYLNVFSTITRD